MRDRVPAYRLAGETFVERIERGQRSLEFVNQLFVVRAVWGYANDDDAAKAACEVLAKIIPAS